MSTPKDEEEEILQRLRQLEKEYIRKKRKLRRSKQAAAAKAHVRQRIQEQLQGQEHDSRGQGCTDARCQVQHDLRSTGDAKSVVNSSITGPRDKSYNSPSETMSPTPCYGDDGLVIGSQDMFSSPKHEQPISDSRPYENKQESSFQRRKIEGLSKNASASPHTKKCVDIPDGNKKPQGRSVSQNLKNSYAVDITVAEDEPQVTCSSNIDRKSGSMLSSKYKRKNFVTKLCPSSPDVADKPLATDGNTLNSSQEQSNKPQTVAFERAQAIIYERQWSDKGNKQPSNQTMSGSRQVNDNGNTTAKASLKEEYNSKDKNSLENLDSLKLSIDIKGTLGKENYNLNKSDQPSAYPSSETKATASVDKRHKRSRRLSLPQRKSPRVYVQSSQGSSDTKSNNSREVSPQIRGNFSQACKSCRPKIGTQRITNKQVMIASMFQCLVDEGKQSTEIEEFSIPDEYLDFCVAKSSPGDIKGNICVNDIRNQENKLSGAICDKHKTSTSRLCYREKSMSLGNIMSINEDADLRNVNELQSQKDKLNLSKMELSDITENRPCDHCTSVNTSKMEDISPTLFESQCDRTDVFNFKEKNTNLIPNTEKSVSSSSGFQNRNETDTTLVETGLRTVNKRLSFESETDSARLSGKHGCDSVSELEDSTVTVEAGKALPTVDLNIPMIDLNVPIRVSEKGNQCPRDLDEASCLQQIGSFKLGSEPVHSIVCVETSDGQLYLACLCPKMLHVYTDAGTDWKCVASHPAKISLRKKTTPVLYGLKDCAQPSVILLENQSMSTEIACYELKGTSLQKHTVNCVNSTGTLLCPLHCEKFAVSYYREGSGHVTRYRRTLTAGVWTSDSLDRTDKPLAGLAAVEGLDSALLGITAGGQLYIWNHDHGVLLAVLDMSDVCPKEPMCPGGFSEQGFLILPVLSGCRQSTAGCLLVVNPHLGTSETLLTFQQTGTVITGCSSGHMSSGLLVARGNNGAVSMWDLYTGASRANIGSRNVSCLATANQIVALTHKQCVHVYKFC